MDNAVLYILVGIILFLIFAFVAYNFIKKELRKRKIKKKTNELEHEINKKYFQYIIEINSLINENDVIMDKFFKNQTNLKMSMIVTRSDKYLDNLTDTKIFKMFFLPDKKYRRFVSELNTLMGYKSNMWNKKIPETIKWFKDQNESILGTVDLKDLVEQYSEKTKLLYADSK
ncbi:MHJ_0274 family protein [Mycoplasmopsis agassizii]|uniref:Uncharacterized protein n=1 Tax=Mycoplasmopsis agassizii TaxID=33922 RepID=A0ABX4H5E9_9BACT|nr:hypothetical protein [Mycoplasmopsis agassizii]PAF55111.1 hypothetical protein CJF60_00280 [Mycoplasmopsis agassizii]SMC16556.1 hypothetical protein SAMN02745179_00279 [Mycoplasmopsis agassizii]